MKSKPFVQCLLATLVFSGAMELTLDAQPATLLPQRNPNRPMLAQGGPGLMAGLGPVANVLTDEQRASFRQAMEAQREKMRDLEIKLREGRRKMIESELDGTFDESAVRKQAQAVATLEAELAVIRAKAISQLQPPLSPEQIGKIKNEFAAPPRGANRLQSAGEPLHNLTSTNRDENDLPVKR